MKEIEKYVGYYLGVYVVVLAICGFFQYFYYCQGQSLMCAVTKTGIVDIVTVTAYVLTPIVAIIGFLNWKLQHNSLILADEAKELLIAINDDIRIFTDISSFFRTINPDLKIQEIYNEDISHFLRDLSTNSSKILSKSMILYELNDDPNFFKIRNDYSFFLNQLERTIFNSLNHNLSAGEILDILDSYRSLFMKNNKIYKRQVRKYILAE